MKVILREWRKRRLLTQAELALASGVGLATISRIEQGQGARPRTLRKLAVALGVRVDQLLVFD